MTHLQAVLLLILKDVDQLLKENNIPYFLDGGSALGAVRHKGFIPWDDDLDISILPEHYDQFVKVCREKLDKEKYYFEEAEKDWPLPFSKIKLNGTYIDEVDAFPSQHQGIYIDIYCSDYARTSKPGKYLQFLLGRLFTACFLARKPYTAKTLPKKLILALGRQISKNKWLYNWIRNQVRGGKQSDELSQVWDRSRSHWTKYFVDKNLFDSSILMDFEDQKFPVCVGYDNYLSKLYGNYMELPPEDQRVGLHILNVDFGKYQ